MTGVGTTEAGARSRGRLLATLLASTAAVLIAAPLQAQETPAGEGDGDAIVVTGIRSSLQNALVEKRDANNLVEVIQAEDIGKLPDQNLAEVLENVTGVQITRQAGVGNAVQIRGTDAKTIEVKVELSDGKPYPAAGKLNFAGSTVDAATGTVQMRAELPNPKFTLLPGQDGSVELAFEYTNCRYYHERANNTVDRVRVTGTVLGREVVRTVELVTPVVVHSQVIINCPERTFVRGDDRRT